MIETGVKGAPDKGGRVIEKLVDTTDLLPSILETAGLPVPEEVQGRSFARLAGGRETK